MGSVATPRIPLRYELIGSPLQEPLSRVRTLLGARRLVRHPELRRLVSEDRRRLALFESELRADSNCIDIGSHYGGQLARMVRLAPRGRHIAVEALPEKAAFIRRKFPQVDVRQVALSDTTGTVTFYRSKADSAYSGMQPYWHGDFEPVEVECRTLDDMVPDDRRIDFVKLDVEGAELMVLRGATRFLARDRPRLLVFCPPLGAPAFGYESSEVFDEVRSLDYDVYTPDGWVRADPPVDRDTFVDALRYPYQGFYWFAVPRS